MLGRVKHTTFIAHLFLCYYTAPPPTIRQQILEVGGDLCSRGSSAPPLIWLLRQSRRGDGRPAACRCFSRFARVGPTQCFPARSGRGERVDAPCWDSSRGEMTSSSTDPPVPLPGPGLCGRDRWAGAEGCPLSGTFSPSPEDPALAGLDWFLEFGSNKQMENNLSNWPPGLLDQGVGRSVPSPVP